MAYDKEKYERNKENILKKQREKYQENIDAERARRALYKKLNKERCAGYERKRRAIKRGSKSEPYTLDDVVLVYGTICYLCDTQIDMNANRRSGYPGWEFGLQLDHLVPLFASGTDTIENVRPTHGLCNVRKNKYILTEGA